MQLLQHITRSRNVSDLSRLVQDYGKKFDAVHVAAAVAMMPKLYQPPAPGGHLNKKQILERKKSAARLLSQLQVSSKHSLGSWACIMAHTLCPPAQCCTADRLALICDSNNSRALPQVGPVSWL